MSANATGTPTTNLSIPKFNTASDAPNGKGVNEMMDALDALLPKGFVQLTNTGDMLYASGANTAARLPIGTGFQRIAIVGGVPVWRTPGSMQASHPGPGGTTSASFVQMQLAGSFTPTFSGSVIVSGHGATTNITSPVLNFIQASYGTGSAPLNNAAQTGTLILANSIRVQPVTANAPMPFAFTSLVTGLTIGTTYWFDYCLSTSGGTASLEALRMTAVEF